MTKQTDKRSDTETKKKTQDWTGQDNTRLNNTRQGKTRQNKRRQQYLPCQGLWWGDVGCLNALLLFC